jgi:hypothetical protein
MTPEKPPAAVRSPLPYAGAGDSRARLGRLQAEFSRVLGVGRVFVRHQGFEHFTSGSPHDALHFPSHGGHSGEARYDWLDRGDGVLYGYPKPDA